MKDGKKMIYLDSTATSKPREEVIDTFQKVATSYWYNPSSMYTTSVLTKNLIDQATNNIMIELGLTNKKIIYTSGATEANNMAIMGICKPYINQHKTIITTEIEHPSVYQTFKELEKEGFNVVYLKCPNGSVDLNELQKNLTKDTILVSIMWVNNIIGSINDIKTIIQMVKSLSHAKLHVDIVQGLAKIKPDFNFNDIDLMSATFHKLGGLKGVGMLIVNNNLQLCPSFYGGHQQDNLRPGTMDAAAIVANAKALRIAIKKSEDNYQTVKKLYEYLINNLKKLPFIIINQNGAFHSPYIISLSFTKIKGETVMHYLEKDQIYVGIGSACNEKVETLERSIMAITLDKTRALNMIRISLSADNTLDEMDILIEKLKRIGNR